MGIVSLLSSVVAIVLYCRLRAERRRRKEFWDGIARRGGFLDALRPDAEKDDEHIS